MKATAIVKGKVLTFPLSRAMAAAHRRNSGRQLSEEGAIRFVESRREQRARKRVSAYREGRA